MDYKEKYNEALEKAKKNYDVAQDLYNGSQIGVECFKNTLTNIFPELKEKENEDEKIRKEIIDFVKSRGGFKGDWIAWLEKQGDKDKLIRELGEYKVKYTQKVLQEDLNKIESQSQPKFKVGDKVTIEGYDTIYTIGSIDHESCWLTLEDSGVGWATFGVLKHYVE